MISNILSLSSLIRSRLWYLNFYRLIVTKVINATLKKIKSKIIQYLSDVLKCWITIQTFDLKKTVIWNIMSIIGVKTFIIKSTLFIIQLERVPWFYLTTIEPEEVDQILYNFLLSIVSMKFRLAGLKSELLKKPVNKFSTRYFIFFFWVWSSINASLTTDARWNQITTNFNSSEREGDLHLLVNFRYNFDTSMIWLVHAVQ